MDPEPPQHRPGPSGRESANGAESNGRPPEQDPEAREANSRATTLEYEVERFRAAAQRDLSLETLERVTEALIPLAIALAAIGIVVATFVVHPWPPSLNLPLVPLGLWAYGRARGRRANGRSTAGTA